MDLVFKALADPNRRLLLDRLREHNGQTLGALCEHLAMARQSATQHLDVLGQAGLVSVVRRGRERLHFLNPVPIHEIEQRWISEFDTPRLRAISAIKNQAEEHSMTDDTTSVPDYVYVTYIHAGAQQVWRALTDADLTARYWGHANVSDIVRLTVTHENLANREMFDGVSHGWPAVLANLKSLLETGDVLPQAPWEMSPAHS